MFRLISNIVMVLAITVFVMSGCGIGDDSGEVERITIDELKDLLDSQADVVVVDVRSENTYASGHIPGAISMTYPEEIRSRHEELPTDKTLVLY